MSIAGIRDDFPIKKVRIVCVLLSCRDYGIKDSREMDRKPSCKPERNIKIVTWNVVQQNIEYKGLSENYFHQAFLSIACANQFIR
jgi:hypothetical protein